jgi:hypothetical protein
MIEELYDDPHNPDVSNNILLIVDYVDNNKISLPEIGWTDEVRKFWEEFYAAQQKFLLAPTPPWVM